MTNICDFFNFTLKEREDRVRFRDLVSQQTGWKYTTFYYKMRTNKLKPMERTILNEIIKTFNYAR